MNKVILMGRLTRDPDVKYSSGENAMAIANYTLAVNRKIAKKGEEKTADFFNCVAFGKSGEFVERYFRKGLKIVVTGRLQNESYTNKEGQKINTTKVIVEEQEFAESKGSSDNNNNAVQTSDDGFMQIPEGLDEELPFN